METSQPRGTIVGFLSGARAATAFLTRIPCGSRPIEAAALGWASAWFPLVGCGLGLVGSLLWTVLGKSGPLVASVATVAFLAFVTGAFHEDGLADTADALGGAMNRDKLFVILKDSRIGSFGAAALFLVLLLRIAALAKLGPVAVGGLIVGQTLSRTTPVALMAIMPYVTPAGTSQSGSLVHARLPHMMVAMVMLAAVVGGLVATHRLTLLASGLSVVVALVVAVLCGWRFHVRAGGLTGDFLGATQQVTDALVLLSLTLIA